MYCKYCGAKIADSAKFCENCGAKVENAAPAYPSQDDSRSVYSAPESSYSKPGTSYSQPGTSYSQPGTSYSQPGGSYSQPGTSYSQPGTSYSRTGASYDRTGDFSVSARPEMLIFGIPVRGNGIWIALGVIAVIVIAIIAITRLGGAKEAAEEDAPRKFSIADSFTERPSEPGSGMDKIAGLYKLMQMSTEEDGDFVGEIELMESIGLTITLELEPDGTGAMLIYGEDAGALTWDEEEITIDGESASYTYENDAITIEAEGSVMIFNRTTTEELRAIEESSILGVGDWTEPEIQYDDASIAGDYYATACLLNGEDAGVDGEHLYVDADGSGYFELYGNRYTFNWEHYGDSFYFLDESGDVFNGYYIDGVIMGDYFDGYYYVFEREGSRPKGAVISPESIPYADADAFSTGDTPTLADFQWLTYDVMNGSLPAGRERLEVFDQACGGWKCYLIDDPYGESDSMMERFLNVYIVGSADDAEVIFDWFYVYDGSEDQGFDDDIPDTTFAGSWSDGGIDALGPGRVSITDFYYLDGFEYGVGTFIWPDGVTALVALVRP